MTDKHIWEKKKKKAEVFWDLYSSHINSEVAWGKQSEMCPQGDDKWTVRTNTCIHIMTERHNKMCWKKKDVVWCTQEEWDQIWDIK